MPGSSMCTKGRREKMGLKEEMNSSEANTIPNSQYTINFGWWLAFIFCLDEQIYCKKNIGSWLHRLLAKSELLSLTRKTNIFKKIIHLLIHCWEHTPYISYTKLMVYWEFGIVFFVNSDLWGKKLLLLQQFAFRRK